MQKKVLNLLFGKTKYSLKFQGLSMLPILMSGDILSFKRSGKKDIYVNDFLMVYKHNQIFTHRVIYKNNKYLILKGDNNVTSDGKIYPRQVLGKVYQVKRGKDIFKPEDIYLLQSTQYFTEIVKIKKELEREKIDFVLLKGLPLHLYYEKSHPKRIYADCDILVDVKDKGKVFKLFGDNSYKEYNNALTHVLRELKNRITEVSFVKRLGNSRVVFDVHLDAVTLINQFGSVNELYGTRDIEKINRMFLENKRTVKIQNETYPILTLENLILYLSYNFFHHNFRGAYRLEFLDKVIRTASLIPPPPGNPSATPGVFLSLSDDIKKYQLQNFVYPVFLLLIKYYDTPLPRKFLESIRPDNERTNYINKNIGNINFFDDETRIQSGVNRFKNLFFMSPNPLWRRLMIIFNIGVVYSFLWVMIFFLRKSLRRSFRSA